MAGTMLPTDWKQKGKKDENGHCKLRESHISSIEVSNRRMKKRRRRKKRRKEGKYLTLGCRGRNQRLSQEGRQPGPRGLQIWTLTRE